MRRNDAVLVFASAAMLATVGALAQQGTDETRTTTADQTTTSTDTAERERESRSTTTAAADADAEAGAKGGPASGTDSGTDSKEMRTAGADPAADRKATPGSTAPRDRTAPSGTGTTPAADTSAGGAASTDTVASSDTAASGGAATSTGTAASTDAAASTETPTATGSKTATRQASAQSRAQPAIAALPIVMMVVPVKVAGDNTTDSAMRDGCWARLYQEKNHKGDTFTLVGPVELANMTGPFGANWEDVSSIETGPRAAVTIYDNVNFRDKAAKIKAGEKVRDLGDEKLGFFEEFKSMKINCSPQTAQAGAAAETG